MTVGTPGTNTLSAAKGHIGLRFVCLDTKSTRFPELPDFPPSTALVVSVTVHHFPSLVSLPSPFRRLPRPSPRERQQA